MQTSLQDFRHATRSLRKVPGFSAAAVLTLALAIGANTAIFSIVENVLLRPLPYRDPASMVQVWYTYPPTIPQGPNSAGDFRDFQNRARSFSEMAAYIDIPRGLNLTKLGDPERLEARYVTSGLFPMLGINPVAGRGFTPEEDHAGNPPTVLMSHHLWERRFGSDPEVVGRTLTLDNRGYLVAGVLPEELRFAPTTDIWMPIGQYDAGPDPYRYHEFTIIGRLKPGFDLKRAQAELAALNRLQQQAFPDTHKNFGVVATPMQDASATKMQTALLVLLGAVGLVLLVACGNFVNLLMARTAAKRRDLAVRVALGASGSRLLSQSLSESVLLSMLGGALGVLLAQAGLRLVGPIVPSDLVGLRETSLNIRVLAFTVAVSLLSGVACGLIPLFQILRDDVQSVLKDGMRRTGAAGGHVIRRTLVVFEIALAIILLVGAGLLIRTFQHLLEVDPGFRRDHILTMEINKSQLSPAEQSKLTTEERIASLREE